MTKSIIELSTINLTLSSYVCHHLCLQLHLLSSLRQPGHRTGAIQPWLASSCSLSSSIVFCSRNVGLQNPATASQPLASPSALAVALVAAAAAAAATAVQIGMGCVRIIGDASLASLNQLHGLLPPPGDIHVHRSLESLEEHAVTDAWHIARPELRHLVRPDHLHLVLRPTSKAVCGGQCSHKVSPCGRVVRTSLRQRARTCAESSLTKEPEIISGTPNCFVTACRHTH